MQQIRTVTTTVPSVDHLGPMRGRQLADRDLDLAKLTEAGYVLASTHTIAGEERVTFVDTLTREDPTA
ncbi:hypothetical protein HP467_01845 [Curtobacterium albidum]|uniref:Uncharacterized protein n=1 Tax=Curtobacterium citreum TaxID=2036 RepID=A0A850DN54_9MICO|nr:hypothetical protein [Curtobacterium albidum]NUU26857.1 hypothetical protein [Curtobacterium albidum]